jgi:asparagine synthase (glutamine-hydrolysing)
MRLMSEVPLGVLLSGGIDSSMVVALMSKIADQQIKTFSVGYEQDYGINEFSYARIVARKFGADHHEIPISTQDFYSFLPRLVWHLDEPISDPATIPLFFLAEFSRKSVTVVLSGEGADEILAGYYIYKKMLLMEQFRKIPKAIRETLIINLLHSVFKSEKHRKYLNLARLPLEERYRGVSRAFQNNSLKQLLKSNLPFQGSLNHHYSQYYDRVGKAHPLNKMLYVDLKNWLPDDLLMKADKMTMAASQELRVPFLDHRLVEFAFSLSPKEKINGDSTKHLLRKIAAEILPQEIIKREKKGFPVPINHWFRGDLNQIASEVLLDSSSVCAQYFDLSYISSLLNEHGNGLQDYSENIWNLIILDFWHKTFMKN